MMSGSADCSSGKKLLVMKHAEFKPDYRKVAQEAGIASANNASVQPCNLRAVIQTDEGSSQKRFKKYVELAGFSLVGGAVVGPGADPGAATPAKEKGFGSRVVKRAPTLAKKRKVEPAPAYEEEGEDEDLEREAGSE